MARECRTTVRHFLACGASIYGVLRYLKLNLLASMFLIFKGLLFWTTLCNYKQYQKLIQKRSRRSDNEYILFKIAAAASHTAGFRVFIFQQKCCIAQDMLDC